MTFKKIVGFGDSWMFGDELLDPELQQKHLDALNALRAGISKEMEEKIHALLDLQETKNQTKLQIQPLSIGQMNP